MQNGNNQENSFTPNDSAKSKPPIFVGSLSDAIMHLQQLAPKFPRRVPGSVVVDGVKLQFADLHSFYHELRQIFAENLYGFQTKIPDPIIFDCGAHVGLASIYFASRYPAAKITAYEADPDICKICASNLKAIGMTSAKVHNQVVWTNADGVCFSRSHDDSGHVNNDGEKLSSIRLRDELGKVERIDMLKLDIEGAEFAVLKDCEEELHRVKALIIEAHFFHNSEDQSLGDLISVLERSGFQTVLSDLQHATWLNADLQTPFDFIKHHKYIVSVFAWRA